MIALGFLSLCLSFQLTSSCLQLDQLAKCETTSEYMCPSKLRTMSADFVARNLPNTTMFNNIRDGQVLPALYFHDPCRTVDQRVLVYCLDEKDRVLDYSEQPSEYWNWWPLPFSSETGVPGLCVNHTWYGNTLREPMDARRWACVRDPRVCQCQSASLRSARIRTFVHDNPFYHSNVSQYNVTVPITSYDEDRCTVSAYCQDGTSLVVFDGKDHYEFGSSELSGMCDAGAKQWIVDDGVHDIVTINLLHMGCVHFPI